MSLPFTHDQFLDVFAAYNGPLWVAALVLWVATILAAIRWFRQPEEGSPVISWLLTAQWLWSGVVYHVFLFRPINPAASVFGVLFILEGGLLAWSGLMQDRLRFVRSGSLVHISGMVLVVYAVLYPFVGLATGLVYPRMPTFGVPCPTVILTAGFLLLTPRVSRLLSVIPILWAAVGGSAAFVLNVRADMMLVGAGVALMLRVIMPGRTAEPLPT